MKALKNILSLGRNYTRSGYIPSALSNAIDRSEGTSLRYHFTVCRWHTDCRLPTNFVLIHTAFSTGMGCWSTFQRAACELPQNKVAPKFPLHMYSLDLRNHGLSPHMPVFDVVSASRDVVDFLRDTLRNPAYLIGCGVGGQIAAAVALGFPTLTKGIVCVNSNIESAMPKHVLTTVMGGNGDAWRSVASQCTNMSGFDKALASKVPNAKERRALLTNGCVTSPTSVQWRMNVEVMSQYVPQPLPLDPSNRVDNIPALFLRDPSAGFEDREIVEKYFPNAVVEDFNCGPGLAVNGLEVPNPEVVLMKALQHCELLKPEEDLN